MTTLIIGGAGFVGAEIVKRWNSGKNGKLLVLDRDSERLANIKLSFPQFVSTHGDASDITLLTKLFDQNNISRVIHLAANSDIKSGSETTNPDFNDTLKTSVAIAEILRFYPIQSLYFSSTSAVYGTTREPISTKKQFLKSPESNYGWAKLACEHLLTGASLGRKNSLAIIRFPNVVGPDPTHGILYDFKNKLKKDPGKLEVLGNGTQKKPYIHVSDLVSVIFRILELESTKNSSQIQEINIGPGDTITVNDIVQLVLSITGLNPQITWGKNPSGWVGDIPNYEYQDEVPAEFKEIKIRRSAEAIRDSFEESWRS